MINIHASYFSIENPFRLLDRWFNPPCYGQNVVLRNHTVEVQWTRRAERELSKRDQPLIVELQLYFSCTIKKRVLFHEALEVNTTRVNDHLSIVFRPVEANSCDPVEFAKNYPVKQEYQSAGAIKMHPKSLLIDYKNDNWVGEFSI